MDLYHGHDLRSRVAQQFISLPYPQLAASAVTSSPAGEHLSPLSVRRRQAVNKPRVSLRWLGNYQNVGTLLALYMLVYMWLGLNVVSTSLLLALTFALYALCVACFKPSDKIKRS